MTCWQNSEQFDLFQTSLVVKTVSQRCYTIITWTTTRPNIGSFCRIIKQLTFVDTKERLCCLADSRTRPNANHKFKFKHLQSNCDAFKHSFSPATIASRNSLPFNTRKTVACKCRGFQLPIVIGACSTRTLDHCSQSRLTIDVILHIYTLTSVNIDWANFSVHL